MNQPAPQILVLSFAAILAISACSTHRTTGEPEPISAAPSNETVNNTIAENNDATYYSELTFRAGSAHLTDEDKQGLQQLVNESVKTGKMDEIKIISWSDQDSPSLDGKRISQTQKHLADERNNAIRDYLKQTYPRLEIEVYNMAKRPNALAELFKASDSRTKQSFLEAGMISYGDHVTLPKQTSKSLILSVLKE